MTNREWLNNLTDEEFAYWCLFPSELDKDMKPVQPYPTLENIKYAWTSSYDGLLDFLKSKREDK